MFFSSFNQTSQNVENEVESESEEEIDYDAEFKDFLNTLNLSKLLQFDKEENLFQYNINDILGNQEDILKMLHEKVKCDNDLIENVEQRIDSMDQTISFYKGFFLDDDKRISRIKANKFLLPDSSNIQDITNSEVQIEDKFKGNDASSAAALSTLSKSFKQAKTIENTSYFSFDEHEFNDLPGGLEAIQLLSHVTNKMGFKDSFLKYWLPIIRSEASLGIVLDTFWWFYLTFFSKDEQHKADAVKYFSRVADSFSALLMSVHSSIRDRFFDNYAKFLSQAIYLAFFQIYVDCRFLFNDSFKQDVCNIIYEWVLGVKPIPETYKKWEINGDLKVTGPQEIKVATTSEILHKIGNLEKLLNSLGNKEPKSEKTTRFSENKSSLIKNYPKDSHVTGQGAVIEKVLFNPKGQSILISHYLKMHNLKEKLEAPAHKIALSEITKQPEANATTYREVVTKTYERSKSAEVELKRLSAETDNEIKKLEKERRKTISEISKIRNADSQTLAALVAKEKKPSLDEEDEEEPTYKEYDD